MASNMSTAFAYALAGFESRFKELLTLEFCAFDSSKLSSAFTAGQVPVRDNAQTKNNTQPSLHFIVNSPMSMLRLANLQLWPSTSVASDLQLQSATSSQTDSLGVTNQIGAS